MSAALLQDIRIVDLSQGRSGALAAMLLAEAGAEVVRIEPLAGDADCGSGASAVHQRSKFSLSLDLGSAAGRARLDALLAAADVLVHDLPDTALDGNLAPAALADRHPHLIASHIGSWPRGHAKRVTPVDDALAMAEAGICDEIPAVGREGPTYLRFPLGEGGAAYLAAAAIAARLLVRDDTGQGGIADTSLVQGALTSVIMLWSRAEHETPMLAEGYRKDIPAFLFECSDGQWIHVMSSPDHVPAMKHALDAMDPDVRAALIAEKNWPVLPSWGANEVVFRTRPGQFWLDALWANDVSVQPVLPMGALYHDEQALANGYVVAVDDPELGPTRQPGPPMQLDPPARVRRPAPQRDDGRALVAGWTPRPRPVGGRSVPSAPLAGVKVLDLGNFLAGPFAPMIMAMLGADVIKLEAASGDQMRWVEWAFTACQRGKRSIAIDLKNPASRPVLEELVRWADIVHHNLRMPAARKLRLDYDSLRAINPGIVYAHVSSYGPVGPRKDWPGYDQLFQASCGWEYEGAGAGNPPIWYRFGMMDHQCALASLVASLLALRRRNLTGEGSFVAASLLGAGMFTLRETVMLADGTLTPYPKLDSRQLGISPQRRLFRCSDGWAMTVTEAPGVHSRLLQELRVSTDADAEAAMRTRDVAAAVVLVRRAGGQAVRAAEDQRLAFLDDADNRAIGLVATYPHPTYGRFEQVGTFFDFGDLATVLDRAPPVLGEHSREILAEIGVEKHAIDAMIAQGLVVVPESEAA